MKKSGGQGGFTLMEMVLSITLIGIAGVTAGMLIYQGARAYEANADEKEATDNAVLSLERISRELRLLRCTPSGNSCAPTSSDVPVMRPDELRFVNSVFEGRGLKAIGGELMFRDGAGGTDPEYPLASGVSSLSFEYLKPDGTAAASPAELWTIGVNMVFVSGQTSVNIKAYVHPRELR